MSTIFQLYRGEQFYLGEGEPEYSMNTNDLPQVMYTLFHIMLYLVCLAMSRIRTHNVSGDMH